MHGHSAAVSDDVHPGDSVLLLCPSMVADEDGACTDLLTLDDPERRRVLCVCLSHSADHRRTVWNRTVGVSPADAAVIVPDRQSMLYGEWGSEPEASERGAALDTGRRVPVAEAGGFDPSVERVGSPGDLTTLGVRITERLDAWETGPTDHRTVVCFDSVSTLLQYTDFQGAYKFLDALVNYVEDAGAIAHFHMDPGAHDEQTVDGLRQLFHSVYAYEDGEWTLRQ